MIEDKLKVAEAPNSELQAPVAEVPNSKLQAPEKVQIPSFKFRAPVSLRRFGIWSLMFLWSLVLGVWCFFGASIMHAQQTPAPAAPRPQDPLITMMLAQPRIDVESPVV